MTDQQAQCPHGHSYGTCLMCYHDLVAEQQSEIERLRVRINGYADANVELRAALKKFGRHPTGDMEGVGRCAGFLRAAPFRDDLCDCGLNTALGEIDV